MSNKNGSKVFEITFGDKSLNELVELNKRMNNSLNSSGDIENVEKSDELFQNILTFVDKFPDDIKFINNLLKRFAFDILSSYFSPFICIFKKSRPNINICDILLNYIEYGNRNGFGGMIDGLIIYFKDQLTESVSNKIKKFIDQGFNIYSSIEFHNCTLCTLIENENEINKSILLHAIENNKKTENNKLDNLLEKLDPEIYDNGTHLLHMLISHNWDFNFIKELIIKYELQIFINDHVDYINYKDNEKYEDCNLLQIYLVRNNCNFNDIKWLIEQSYNQCGLISHIGYYIGNFEKYDRYSYNEGICKERFNCLTYALLYCSLDTELIKYLMDIYKNELDE